MQQNSDDHNAITLEELVWQESFRSWVLHPTPEQTYYWQNWLDQHPAQADTLTQAREVVLALQVKNRPITDADIQAIIDTTRQYLDLPIATTVRPLNVSSRWQIPSMTAAAAVVFVMLVGAGLCWRNQHRISETIAAVHTKAATAGLIVYSGTSIRLEDGSQVRLRSGSELRYPAHFSDDLREVYLTGEATFNVQRRPDQPFLVHANGAVTRVLGTRFTVLAPAGGTRVTVNVLSGKVSVLPETEWVRANQQAGYQPKTVIVTPNQQVVFERDHERLSKTLVEQPVVVQTTGPAASPNFNFVNTPVPVVLKILEQAYGIPIVFDAQVMQHCLVTAPLGDEPLFEKLAVICETIDARYEVVETQIIITGKGCTM